MKYVYFGALTSQKERIYHNLGTCKCRCDSHHKGFPSSLGNLVPRFSLLPVDRPWLGLVTWSQNKINSQGGVLCLSIFLSGSFSPFTQ